MISLALTKAVGDRSSCKFDPSCAASEGIVLGGLYCPVVCPVQSPLSEWRPCDSNFDKGLGYLANSLAG